MIVDPFVASLLGNLSNPLMDADLLKQGIKLLLYNAETFLQVRRAKLLKEQETSQSGPKAPPTQANPSELAPSTVPNKPPEASQPTSYLENVPSEDQTLQIAPDLSEFWIRTAENEIDSLLRQLETHFRMLSMKEEQMAKFAEFAPIYMKMGIENEQQEIVQKLKRLSNLMKQIYGKDYTAIDQLSKLI